MKSMRSASLYTVNLGGRSVHGKDHEAFVLQIGSLRSIDHTSASHPRRTKKSIA
jgi:hypothetical protein